MVVKTKSVKVGLVLEICQLQVQKPEEKADTQKHKSWIGSARADIAVFQHAQGSNLLEILRDWSKVGGLGNSSILTHE